MTVSTVRKRRLFSFVVFAVAERTSDVAVRYTCLSLQCARGMRVSVFSRVHALSSRVSLPVVYLSLSLSLSHYAVRAPTTSNVNERQPFSSCVVGGSPVYRAAACEAMGAASCRRPMGMAPNVRCMQCQCHGMLQLLPVQSGDGDFSPVGPPEQREPRLFHCFGVLHTSPLLINFSSFRRGYVFLVMSMT